MDNEAPLTFNQVVRGISEFIEVAIHTILYVRQVYPVDLFVRRKKYDTVVFQSRHPALNEYISGAVKAIEDELLLGALDKVVVVIKDKDEVALERFIFALHSLVNVESYNRDTSVEEAMTPRSLGQYFRSFLVKLSMIEAQLGQIKSTGQTLFSAGGTTLTVAYQKTYPLRSSLNSKMTGHLLLPPTTYAASRHG
ncbi:hypothetical protein EVJ58_g93 [Rhodofomes roseus]|uniref:HORMA domain-containing protein n=1 Tax=Rhodofomes roseus TaxID=34475 RepID=A0A4Y9Z653_9APHY|nr:hypothetical protein EVJ58_g93 [Rhodofomes roseus]